MTQQTGKAKDKLTIYLTLEVIEALRNYVFKARSKNSREIETALRKHLGLKNN